MSGRGCVASKTVLSLSMVRPRTDLMAVFPDLSNRWGSTFFVLESPITRVVAEPSGGKRSSGVLGNVGLLAAAWLEGGLGVGGLFDAAWFGEVSGDEGISAAWPEGGSSTEV